MTEPGRPQVTGSSTAVEQSPRKPTLGCWPPMVVWLVAQSSEFKGINSKEWNNWQAHTHTHCNFKFNFVNILCSSCSPAVILHSFTTPYHNISDDEDFLPVNLASLNLPHTAVLSIRFQSQTNRQMTHEMWLLTPGLPCNLGFTSSERTRKSWFQYFPTLGELLCMITRPAKCCPVANTASTP